MSSREGVGDFDFLVGRWTVASRRLRHLFVGSDDWYDFQGTSECRSFFDGAGNFDEVAFPSEGFRGISLRLFDPATGDWSIYWANSITGRLFPPTIGRFAGGRGDFFGDDEEAGRPIRVHFTWSEITPTSARWEQEFSPDGGTTWESNWVMEFQRAE
jgi:hypothetical protein